MNFYTVYFMANKFDLIWFEYRHEWYIAKTRFFRLHFCCRSRKYRWIFNHFYAVGTESYRIRWNDAK